MDDMLSSLLYRVKDDLPAILVELALIGLCVNWCASVLHSTRGTRPLRGVLVVLVVATVIVRVFGWERLELLYQYVLVGLAFIALIVFQPELRRALIRVGDVPFQRSRGPQSQLVSALVKSAGYLSRNRYGALIAIQRDVDLTGWAENGTIINAEVSANLLNTVFFPNSPLHDLGVIIRGTRVLAANCQFPSPDSDEIDAALGSRHLAAVGMSYESDALVLVVSEETGVISLADNGKLTRYLTLEDLTGELNTRLERKGTRPGPVRTKSWSSLAWRRLRRFLVVVPLTAVIWYLVDQATLVDASVELLVNLRHSDPSYIVEIEQPRANVVDPDDPRALVLGAKLVGPARAIDQVLTDAAERPLRLTWELPEVYSRPGVYELSAEQVMDVLDGLREIQTRGLNVQQISVKRSVEISVDELVSIRLPVTVQREGAPIDVEQIVPPTVEARLRQRDQAALPPVAQRGVRAPLGEERLRDLQPEELRTFERVAVEPRVGSVRLLRVNPETVSVTVRGAIGEHQTIRNVVVHLFVSPDVTERFDVRKSDLNEWRIDVDVAGKEERLRGLGPADIDAFVHLRPDMLPAVDHSAEEQLRLLNVRIQVPEGVRLLGDRTRTVRVNLIPKSAPTP